jgi:hypothetical protein
MTDQPVIRCPVCQFDYSHIRAVFTRLGTDEGRHPYPGTVARERTEHSERRAALVIVLDGECGHTWELVIQQHKGNNYVETRVLPSSAAPQK